MENEDRFPNLTDENKAENISPEEAEKQLGRLREMLERESEHIKMPDSLSAENMLHLLDGIEPGEKSADTESTESPAESAEGDNVTHADFNKKKQKRYVRWAALAACFALVVVGVRHMSRSEVSNETVGVDLTESAAASIRAVMSGEGETAQSYDEIYDMLLAVQQESGSYYSVTTDGTMLYDSDSAVNAINDAPAMSVANEAVTEEAADSISFADGYTATNTQYSDVDESDIVKTDGEYIYHFRYDGDENQSELVITDAETLEVLSRTEFDGYISGEIYIDGDTLAIVYSADWQGDAPAGKVSDYVTKGDDDTEVIVPDWYYTDNGDATTLLIYDISDRQSPKAVTTLRQSGYYVSSRMAQGVIYLVSNRYVDLWGISYDAEAISAFPAVTCNGEGEILAADCVYLPESLSESANYCVVTAYDTASGERQTKAVLGTVDNIIMTGDTLILASTVYDGSWTERNTGITRFTVGGSQALTYVSSGKVDGWIDGQFSLDVTDGLLRIATTTYNDENETENGVYIYDEDMSLVGSVTGLAPGERIYSVRYLGDTAYIVTFRETDPLFAVDLSDPENPKVLGQLKIPGFSEYLHPAGDGLLIGLGNSTATTSYGSVITDGIKLSLFDISDPANPTEIDTVLLGNNGSSSEALSNHKAFMWDGANGRFGFPATLVRTYGATTDNPWGTSSSTVFDGYLVYTYDENGFTRVGEAQSAGDADDPFARSDYSDTILRGAVIGDTLYTVSEGGIDTWSYSTFEKTGEVRY